MENQDPSRTEEASGKRMGEERDKGNVMISQDVLSVVLLLIALPVTFLSTMPVTYDCFIAIMNQIDQVDCRTEWTDSQIQHGGFLAFIVFCKAALPVMLATAIAAIVATFSQIGWYFSTETLNWKFEEIFHFDFKALMPNGQNMVNFLTTMGKVLAISVVVYLAIRTDIDNLIQLSFEDVDGALLWLTLKVTFLVIKIMLFLIVLAIIDYTYRHMKYNVDLRMTKEEIKDEHRNAEGDPMIKAKIRSKMMAMLKRIINEVPKADVVITNPTHVAVALKYDTNEPAPRVIAKGLRKRALRIKEIAKLNGVPIVENPPLARAMYRSAPVGGFIPAQFFGAVAAVLAKLHKAGVKTFNMAQPK